MWVDGIGRARAGVSRRELRQVRCRTKTSTWGVMAVKKSRKMLLGKPGERARAVSRARLSSWVVTVSTDCSEAD